MSNGKILVTGATGNVGGSVARELLKRERSVRVLVRDTETEKAKALAAAGAELARGDLSSPESLAAVVDGVDTVFGLTTPMTGVDLEVAHGKALIDAARVSGVGHFVFSSVASADKQTGIPHFDSKWEIEKHLTASGLNWTVTAPAFFYDNVLFPWNAVEIGGGSLRQALPPTRSLQMISVRDIGRFNAEAIEGRDAFFGKRIEIASDEMTGPDMAGALGAAIDIEVTYVEQSLEEVASQFEDMATMYKWFDDAAFDVDVTALKAAYPAVEWIGFGDWAAEHHAAFRGAS